MDTSTEELAYIEMIARLLEGAPVGDLEIAAQDPGHWSHSRWYESTACDCLWIRRDASR